MKRSHRPLLYLFIALAVAGAVLLLERPQAPRVDDSSGSYLVPGLSTDKVRRVEVTQLMDGAALSRDDAGKWSVSRMTTPLNENVLRQEGREAPPSRPCRGDASRIRGAISTLIALPEGVVVSRNAENRREYRVDDPTGLRVRLFGKDDAVLADLLIGNSGPDFNGTYLRRAGSEEVRLVSRPLLGVFSPMVKDWRQRRFWNFPPDAVASVAIDDQGKTTTLTAGEKDAEATRFAAAISISAEAFPDEDEAAPGRKEMTVAVELKDGKRFVLNIFAPDARGRYPAQMEGEEEIVFLSKKTLEALRAGPQGRG